MIAVIYHKVDFDGIFCREIARRALPKNTKFIGWTYGDTNPNIERFDTIYMLDVHIKEFMELPNIVWIDHHKTAIEKFNPEIKGLRIDGVAACRLAWQYFNSTKPEKDIEAYVERVVDEPFAVTLAGEYDVWDHRGDGSFEFNLALGAYEDPQEIIQKLLNTKSKEDALYKELILSGKYIDAYNKQKNISLMTRSFLVDFEGIKFLALNCPKCNSQAFESLDAEGAKHQALMAFSYDGEKWSFSLYQSKFHKEIDLSVIATKWGGGGHRAACGFVTKMSPI